MSTSIKTSNNLSFLAWNINGLSSKSLGDKSQHSEFLDVINNFDFVILCETWTRSNVIEVRGFRFVTQDATQSRKGGRDSHGIVLLYQDTFHDWISIVKNTCNFLWFKIEKDHVKTVKDIYTCGLYISLCNSPYFNLELLNDIEIFSSQCSILLMGDLTARKGKFPASVCNEGNNFITKDQSEFSLYPTQGNSFDNEFNSHGKALLEICKSADLRILNGRVTGDSLGRVTFHGKNGVSTSVVDYAVCDQDLLSHVANFVVKDPLHLSDHSPITTWLNINKKTSYNHTILEGDTLTRLPKQFLWENDSAQKFKDALRSPRIQTLTRDYIAGDTFNENTELSLEKVENILITTAKYC